MMNWLTDPNLLNPDMVAQATPCLRLSAQFPYKRGYFADHVEAFERIFQRFIPFVKADCDRIAMWDRPGAPPRRSNKIRPEYWKPFVHLKSRHDNNDDAIFSGFRFYDREDIAFKGGKQTEFHYFLGVLGTLEACIPCDKHARATLDVPTLIEDLLSIPLYGFSLGYGLSLSEYFPHQSGGQHHFHLKAIADRYPALDVQHYKYRDSPSEISAASMDATAENFWIPNIGWITGVGNVFLEAKGGLETLRKTLPDEITIQIGTAGAAFQLGAQPISGLSGVDDADLPLYHKLGEALRPLDYPNQNSRHFQMFSERNSLQTLAWMRRFYT